MTKTVFDRRATYGDLCLHEFETEAEVSRYREYIHERVEAYGLEWMPDYSEIWCDCTPDGKHIHTFPIDEMDFDEWFKEIAEAAYQYAIIE